MTAFTSGLSLQVPERVYAAHWAAVTEQARWSIARDLGLSFFPLEVAEYLNDQLVTQARFDNAAVSVSRLSPSNEQGLNRIRFTHPDKNLSARPLLGESLWRELLPYPFCLIGMSEAAAGSPGLQAEPDALAHALRFAHSQMVRLEEALTRQELGAVVSQSESGELLVVAFQTVRKKRVRLGMLTGAALEWVREKINSPESATDGLPRMVFYSLSLASAAATEVSTTPPIELAISFDKPISGSLDSTVCLPPVDPSLERQDLPG